MVGLTDRGVRALAQEKFRLMARMQQCAADVVNGMAEGAKERAVLEEAGRMASFAALRRERQLLQGLNVVEEDLATARKVLAERKAVHQVRAPCTQTTTCAARMRERPSCGWLC